MAATTGMVMATAVVVVVGKWAKDGALKDGARIAIGAAILALMLAGIDAANPKLASRVAGLILVTALLLYTVPILKKLGFDLPGVK